MPKKSKKRSKSEASLYGRKNWIISEVGAYKLINNEAIKIFDAFVKKKDKKKNAVKWSK